MALIKCPECGHDVSDKAESCPNCGYKISEKTGNDTYEPQKQNKSKKTILGVMLLMISISLFTVTKNIDVLFAGALITGLVSVLGKKN